MALELVKSEITNLATLTAHSSSLAVPLERLQSDAAATGKFLKRSHAKVPDASTMSRVLGSDYASMRMAEFDTDNNIHERASIPSLEMANKKLNNLLNNKNIDGYIFKPTVHALKAARKYLLMAHIIMGQFYFDPAIIPDGEGGIDLEWESADKHLMLSFRNVPERKDILYYQYNDEYGGDEINLPLLKEKLQWLIRDAK